MASSLPSDPPPEAQKPTRGESVLLEPVRRVCQYVERISQRAGEKQLLTEEECRQVGEAVRLLRELMTFATPPGPELTRRALEAGARALAEFSPPGEAQRAFFAAGDYTRGRPVKRRHVAAASKRSWLIHGSPAGS